MAGLGDQLLDRGKRLARRLSNARTQRMRTLPALRTTAESGARTVYYLCPDYPTPSGGVRAIYSHVDILNEAGIDAAVLHCRDGFSCDWFDHSTRIVGAPSARIGPQDSLVIPEIYGPHLDRLPRDRQLVLFNQNAYFSFDFVPPDSRPDYGIFDAVLTVSDDSAEFLRFAFPGLDVDVVAYSIDPDLFHTAADTPPRRLALMPRKRPQDAEMILRLLGNRLNGWEVMRIEGVTEQETARLLRSSPIFLALGREEGFGLPAAEAMASGCYVIGFSGFGGRVLFDPSWSTPIEDGDLLGAARAIATTIATFEREPEIVRSAGAEASREVLARFSPRRQAQDLVAFHRRIAESGS